MLLLLLLAAGLLPCSLTQGLSGGISNLALQMSSNLEKSGNKNFVWSPYSAHSALSQVLLGSGGSTLVDLERVLGVSQAETANYQRIQNNLKNEGSVFKDANLLAVNKGFKPLPAFTQLIQARFGSQLRELDFSKDRSNSVKQVNEFVSSATSGQITDILSDDQVDDLTRLLIVNAVYFKGVWKNSFAKAENFETTFRSSSGDVKALFMNAKLKVRLADVGDYEVLELPYTDQNKALLIILPKEGVSSDNIFENIRNYDFSSVRNEKEDDTIVTVPKFTIRETTFLKAELSRLGLGGLFSTSANLQGISAEPLYVSDAVQQAFIEVNEEGTEAAAATAVIIGLRTGKRTRQFFADRPFAFVVYDFSESIPIFAGKLTNPSAAGVEAGAGTGLTDAPVNTRTAAGENTAPDTVQCIKYRNDFPNALENSKLCEMARSNKLLDWLRQYRSVCESSVDLYSNFQKNQCREDWCLYAQGQEPGWKSQNTRLCGGVVADGNVVQCRQLANQLSAFAKLDCADL